MPSNNRLIASVVIPSYNCSSYIGQCLNSLLVQTLSDFEVIVVDDGSTDGSLEIAKRYVSKDSRVTVLQQAHSFAGAARNLGIQHAQGQYLLFLDSDDYFEPVLLERAVHRIEETEADICVYGANWLNDKTGEIRPMNNACRVGLCPPHATFSRHTNPRNIFCFTTPAPWTKLYRKSFIEENGLRFQETRSANDLRFTFTSLAVAEKITVLDEKLVTYRRENSSSLQSTQGKDPFAFFHALVALRDELQERNAFSDIHHAYVNAALDMCMYNLRTLRNSPESQRAVFNFLRDTGFTDLELAGRPRNYFYEYPSSRYDDYLLVRYGSFDEYRQATAPAVDTANLTLRQKLRRFIPLRASVYDRRRDKTDKQLKLLRYEIQQLAEQNAQLVRAVDQLQKKGDGDQP